MKKKLSIITPVYNEEENILPYYARMLFVLEGLKDKYDFEFIFTDNCSEDNTFNCLHELSKKDSRIKVYSFSRNFGYQKSILTGYQKCTGNAAIEFDCDLQDPPEMIAQFLKEWEAGSDIVYGIRTHRQEGRFIGLLRKVFYRLIAKISENDLPYDAGDFMLIDEKILIQLRTVNDTNLYLRGLIFGYGFKRTGICYSRDARVRGVSKFPYRRMFELAVDGIISQSILPLRLASYLGLAIALVTCFMSLFYIGLKFFSEVTVAAGFTTTVLLILFSISINAIFLGIIGEYLARIYTQTKNRPLTIIRKSIDQLAGDRHAN